MNSLQILIVFNILLVVSALGTHLWKGTFRNPSFDKVLTGILILVLFHLGYVLTSKLYFSQDNWIEDSAPFGLMYGPFIYFLLQSYRKGCLSRKSILIHLLPFFLFSVIQIYFLAIGLDSQSDAASIYMRILYTLIPTSFVIYAIWGFRQLSQFPEKIKALFHFFLLCIMILLLVVAVYFFNVSLDTKKPMIDTGSDMGGMMLYSFLSLGNIFLLFLLGRKNSVPEIVVSQANNPIPAEEDHLSQEPVKPTASYEKSSLTPEVLILYEQKLDQYMDTHDLWKDHELKLDILADKLKIQRHHLTQVLSFRKGKNFNSYINEMRVDHVCKLMKEKKEDVSLADIGYMSGFNSKSTYYRWFKTIKNMTPAQYYETLNDSADNPSSGR